MQSDYVKVESGDTVGLPSSYSSMLAFLFSGSGVWAMVVFVCIAAGYKSVLGVWDCWDAVVIACFFIFRGVIEWLIHSLLYHANPLPLVRLRLASSVSEAHWKHHCNPGDLSTLLVTWKGVAAVMLTVLLVFSLLLQSPDRAMSFVIGFSIVAFFIEVVHLICHSRIPHRTRFMQRLVQLHRAHHHVSQVNYYGVSSSLGDRVFGTFPRR